MTVPTRLVHWPLALVALIGLAPLGFAQSFQSVPAKIPQGSPFNNSSTNQVEFADVDLDGDLDALNADGGDCCNDQNRLWVNVGFAQGGSLGFFEDRTSTQFPTVLDTSRDMDFGDLDADGDADLYTANTSDVSPQSSRIWINMGLSQAGSAGFFEDQTSTRWLGLGVNNGTNLCSSIAPSQVLANGGFIDWAWDSVLGDFDGDGDLDLLHTSAGPSSNTSVPSRMFLNDGQGRFREHNPSCFALTTASMPENVPALWSEGLQKTGTLNAQGDFADIALGTTAADIGDLDGDFDLDFLLGSVNPSPARLFRNMRQESNSLVWRDVTYGQMASPGSGNSTYDQEFGDFDNDGDLDLFGFNWFSLNDAFAKNDGAGNFGMATVQVGGSSDHDDGQFIDYNADGYLDLYLPSWGGVPQMLFRNTGGTGFVNVSNELPYDSSISTGIDTADVDQDGDYDVLTSASSTNKLYERVGALADTTAPKIPLLSQIPNRPAGPPPSIVRAHVYDNASWDVVRYNPTLLEYQVAGGTPTQVPMNFVGGQMFQGEIPGSLVGTVDYRVLSSDEHGNSAVSALKSFSAFISTCSGSVASYCTAKQSSGGCLPSMSATGNPSFFAPQVFTITASNLDPGQNGLMFFGTDGPQAHPFLGGLLCVKAPLYRGKVRNSQGAGACSGWLSYSLQECMAVPVGGGLLLEGQSVAAQVWFRDPADPFSVGLSDGLQFTVCP